jgi:hypothetical protein
MGFMVDLLSAIDAGRRPQGRDDLRVRETGMVSGTPLHWKVKRLRPADAPTEFLLQVRVIVQF